MEPYQQRVIDEKTELDKKLAALQSFIGTETFYALEFDEKRRLQKQSEVMEEYSAILEVRILNFK